MVCGLTRVERGHVTEIQQASETDQARTLNLDVHFRVTYTLLVRLSLTRACAHHRAGNREVLFTIS